MARRSNWVKSYINTSHWPVVNEKNIDHEYFSLWPFRANGCFILIGQFFMGMGLISLIAGLLFLVMTIFGVRIEG